MNPSLQERRAIERSVVFAGLFLLTSLVVKSMTPNELSHETSQRLFGVWLGVIVAYFGDSIPKERPSAVCLNSAMAQSLRRFTAWNLVVGGVGFALLSAFAPYEASKPLAVSFLGACMVLVVFRHVSTKRGPSNPQPLRPQRGERS